MNRPWSIWLEPCKTDRIRLQKLIKDVYAHFNSPVFDPHITLFGRVDIDPSLAFPSLIEIVSGHRQIELGTIDIQRGKSPWKTLFIQFKKSDAIEYLQHKIDQEMAQYHSYEFDPHLSLVYGDLDINKLEFDHISFPETITFSSVVLMETPDDINEWKLILQADLIGGIVL